MPCARAFSPRSNASCSTAAVSTLRSRRAWRCSSSSRAGTTPIAVTPPSTICRQSTTKGVTTQRGQPQALRHPLNWGNSRFEKGGDASAVAIRTSHCRQTGQRKQVLSGLKQGTNQNKNSPVTSQPAVRKVVNPCFHRGGDGHQKATRYPGDQSDLDAVK